MNRRSKLGPEQQNTLPNFAHAETGGSYGNAHRWTTQR